MFSVAVKLQLSKEVTAEVGYSGRCSCVALHKMIK